MTTCVVNQILIYKNKIYHHSSKEYPKINNIAKIGREVL